MCSLVHWCTSDTKLNTSAQDYTPAPQNLSHKHLVLNTIWSSIIRIQPNTPEDGHIDARNM